MCGREDYVINTLHDRTGRLENFWSSAAQCHHLHDRTGRLET